MSGPTTPSARVPGAPARSVSRTPRPGTPRPGAPGPGTPVPGASRTPSARRAPLAWLAAVVVLLTAANLLLGSYTVTVPDLIRIAAAEIAGDAAARIPGASFIVWEVKVPQALTALGAGAAFGMAGWLFQTLLRNPLASPDVIGISYGASAAAVALIVLAGAAGWAVPHAAVSAAAFAGALAVAGLIWFLAEGSASSASRGGRADARLVLVGIGLAAGLQALVGFLLTRTDVRYAHEALAWLNGSLASADWGRLGVLYAALAVLVPAALAAASPLSVLALGDDAARGLGLHAARARGWVVLAGVALAAAGTAATGPIAFVAFLAAPIARRLGARGSSARDLAAAGLTGCGIVLAAAFAADAFLPALLGGTTLPVGVVTGAIGAPVLLWLLTAVHRKEG
ncbi:FecCD family ABC transporter permease [Sinomonas halotolerans]|uniref:Iron chelate uptake ABC transporter family permease subunit n=1 Tax=Sinomonas halotolerans TaxID=1644133 RepID=A0ABU9WZC9_9MICC